MHQRHLPQAGLERIAHIHHLRSIIMVHQPLEVEDVALSVTAAAVVPAEGLVVVDAVVPAVLLLHHTTDPGTSGQ
jgi:hypothetical protein